MGSKGLAIWTTVLTIVTVPSASPAMAQSFPVSASLSEESRQFDFWIGAWDVNLRVLQDDLTWADQAQSVAKVYPILMGKAVLELWSDRRDSGIKGYSLRYFDIHRGEWVLWLNWPGTNRSGSSSLSGSFRHGRGEFFATRQNPEGTETISRYTFSDITPESLRWDDAFSTDGGNTWTNRWIMEFTRTAARPLLSPEGGPEHTFHTGTRCDAPEFRAYEFLSGLRSGPVEAGGEGSVTITGHKILDGCAVMTFAGPSADPERAFAFSHITWNTYVNRYELTTLTSGASTPVRMFYSQGPELVLYERGPDGEATDRMRLEHNDDGTVTWAHEVRQGEGWRPVWQARLGRQ